MLFRSLLEEEFSFSPPGLPELILYSQGLRRIIHEMRHLPASRERLRRPAVRKGFAFPRARLIFSSEHSARLSLAECSEMKKHALAESRRLSAQQGGKAAVELVRFMNNAD